MVRPPSGGDVTLDTTGKAAGRGVYLCANVACLAKARKAKRLERSLDTAIPDAVYEALESLMPSSRGEEESHGDRTS